MYVYHQKGDATLIFEHRLCCFCARMFCIEAFRHIRFVRGGMIFYAHERCPAFKEPPLQLERRK